MTTITTTPTTSDIDTSDLERYIGVPLGRVSAHEPVSVSDIRRWVQAMHHPNPLHYDVEYARASRFGRIVAPQSFTIVTNIGHGARPAVLGNIPDSHMVIAGDEWWFFGPSIFPDDRITVDHMGFDFRVTSTKFAGPTVIQRGDNHYTNQRGEKIALQRTTALRYRPAAAREAGTLSQPAGEPEWELDDLKAVTREKELYAASIHDLGHGKRTWESVNEGDQLPVKVIGPHSIFSFTSEWRAYLMNIWSALQGQDIMTHGDTGMRSVVADAPGDPALDPEFADRGYFSPHLGDRHARRIGMPRAYGFGASIGSWIIDFLADWAGEWGSVAHTVAQYRAPVLTGDVTYFKATVTGKGPSRTPSHGEVRLDLNLVNQDGGIVAKGSGDVLLPRE